MAATPHSTTFTTTKDALFRLLSYLVCLLLLLVGTAASLDAAAAGGGRAGRHGPCAPALRPRAAAARLPLPLLRRLEHPRPAPAYPEAGRATAGRRTPPLHADGRRRPGHTIIVNIPSEHHTPSEQEKLCHGLRPGPNWLASQSHTSRDCKPLACLDQATRRALSEAESRPTVRATVQEAAAKRRMRACLHPASLVFACQLVSPAACLLLVLVCAAPPAQPRGVISEPQPPITQSGVILIVVSLPFVISQSVKQSVPAPCSRRPSAAAPTPLSQAAVACSSCSGSQRVAATAAVVVVMVGIVLPLPPSLNVRRTYMHAIHTQGKNWRAVCWPST